MATKSQKSGQAEAARTAEAAARSPSGNPSRPGTRARSAETGKMVTKAEAKKSPKTTVIESVGKVSKAEVMARVSKELKVPKTPGAQADMLYVTREKRLNLQKEIDALAAFETKLKNELIENLPKSSATGAAGKIARVQIVTEDVPVVQDWDEFYKHIKKKGEFDLLNRAANRTAIRARWDNNKTVPGVGHFQAVKVSVTKVG